MKYLRGLGREFLFLCGLRSSPPSWLADFCAANAHYWRASEPKDSEQGGKKTQILVSGFLASFGPNYLLRTSLVAQALAAKHRGEISVVFDDFAFSREAEVAAYESFSIKNFTFLSRQALRLYDSILGYWDAKAIFSKVRVSTDILPINYRGIRIGDQIYDEILHSEPSTPTIEVISEKYFKYFFAACSLARRYERYIRRAKPDYLVTTHVAYLQYSILSRLAAKYGAKIIVTTDSDFNTYELDPTGLMLETFHAKVHNFMQKKILQFSQLGKTQGQLQDTEKYLQERFQGNLNQVDVLLAYKDKKNYSDEEIRARLGIKNSQPFAVLMGHIFSDTPHCSDFMLFPDFYQWLKKTLVHAKNVKSVNWLVKPHPAAKVYREEGLTEALVAELGADNIFIVPSDFSPQSIIQIARAIVTVHGTAGLEFSCLGIPSILAGRPFYSQFGFTHEPETSEKYFSLLNQLSSLPVLSQEQIQSAKLALAAYRQYATAGSKLLTTDILLKVWGYGQEGRDLPGAYAAVTKLLATHHPQQEEIYRMAGEIS